jgi:WD40 repeat protein
MRLPVFGICGRRHRPCFLQAIRPQWQMSSARIRTRKSSLEAWTRLLGLTYCFNLGVVLTRLVCRLWDLAAGKTMVQLTHHKKSVRTLCIHPQEYSFASGSAGGNNIKKWKCPDGAFVHNFSGHNAIINTLSVNEEGVMFSGGAFHHSS